MKYKEDPKTQEAIDNHLRALSKLECNLGMDSTPEERRTCKAAQEQLFAEIKILDPEFYKLIRP